MYIKVIVTPKAKNESFRKVSDNQFEVSVKEEAKGNRANKRVLELMRKQFTASGVVKIVSGHHSPHKIISIDS